MTVLYASSPQAAWGSDKKSRGVTGGGIKVSLHELKSNRNLIFLAIMIFLLSIGEGLSGLAIPLFGLILGGRYWQLGLLMTGFGVAYAAMTMLSGRLSDITGRKLILVSSIVMTLGASLGYIILSKSITSLLVFRALEGASKGVLWPVAEAAVADTVTGDPGQALGVFTAAYGFGESIGAFSNIFVLSSLGPRGCLTFYPWLSLATLMLMGLGFRPAGGGHRPAHAPSGRENGRRGWNLAIVRPLWPLGVVGFTYAGFLYAIMALFSALAHAEGIASIGIGLLFTLFWMFRTVAFFLTPVFKSRLGGKQVLIASLLVCCAGAGALMLGGSLAMLGLGALLSGIGTGTLFPLCLILVNERVQEENRGLGMGFLEFFMGSGTILQPSIAGLIGEWLGVGWTYLSIFVTNVLAIAVSGYLFRQGDESAGKFFCASCDNFTADPLGVPRR